MTQPREVIERFFELFAAGKITDSMDLFDPACTTLMPGGPLSMAEHEQMGHAFKEAFPDSRMEVDHLVEAGDEIVVLGHFRGTHMGDLAGPAGVLPASGKPLDLRFIDYFRLADGKIVDHQTVFDQVELLTQVGALPGS